MDIRARMLDVIQGRVPDAPLFVPRLDIWYNAHKTRGTLPGGYQDLSLREITRKLGVGFHSVVPDFIRTGNEEDIYHRALGFYNHPDFPYRADFSNIEALRTAEYIRVDVADPRLFEFYIAAFYLNTAVDERLRPV